MDDTVPPPGRSPIPDPARLELSDEQVRALQRILKEESGVELSFEAAKQRGLELLRLFLMFLDPEEYERRLKTPDPPAGIRPVEEVFTPPTPQPHPIRLDRDHYREIEDNLRMLEYELAQVKSRPTSWRWAVVALYNLLGHVLALRKPIPPVPNDLHHLTRLFDAVAKDLPQLAAARSAVEVLETLRTTWLTQALHRWPAPRQSLPRVLLTCAELVAALRGEAVVQAALGRLTDLSRAS